MAQHKFVQDIHKYFQSSYLRKNGSKNFFHIPCNKKSSLLSISSPATTTCLERRRNIV
ncbi:hypothetical protein ACHAXS_001943, partial [Conticribra weissflogii]